MTDNSKTRHTVTVPDGHEAIRDAEGRATGEVRPIADKSEPMTDLKACPFCGSDKIAVGHTDLGHDVRCFYYGAGCKSRTGIWPTRTEAIAAWNRRTPVTAEAGEVSEAEVEAALQAYFGDTHPWSLSMGAAVRAEVLDGMRAALLAARRVQPKQDAPGSDVAGLIEHMVGRFLGWRLPDNFSPDAGISFKADYNENTPWPAKHKPTGTNLFDATQAGAMVRYMIDGYTIRAAILANLKQDDAQDSTVGAAVSDEEAAASLASARAEGTREGLLQASEWHYARAAAQRAKMIEEDGGYYRNRAELHEIDAAAIRALINKDAGEDRG